MRSTPALATAQGVEQRTISASRPKKMAASFFLSGTQPGYGRRPSSKGNVGGAAYLGAREVPAITREVDPLLVREVARQVGVSAADERDDHLLHELPTVPTSGRGRPRSV